MENQPESILFENLLAGLAENLTRDHGWVEEAVQGMLRTKPWAGRPRPSGSAPNQGQQMGTPPLIALPGSK